MLFLKVSGVGGGSKMQARGYQNDRLKGKRSKVRPKWAMRRQHKTRKSRRLGATRAIIKVSAFSPPSRSQYQRHQGRGRMLPPMEYKGKQTPDSLPLGSRHNIPKRQAYTGAARADRPPPQTLHTNGPCI